MLITTSKTNSKPQHGFMLGLKGLEKHVEQDTYVYILRSLYRIVFKAKELKESKLELQDRIIAFEKHSNLPGYLSAIPIEELLAQLEDAQYIYPLRQFETELPTFH